jgi:hypothetical protein
VTYSTAYYLIALLSTIFIPAFIPGRSYKDGIGLRTLILLSLTFVYGVGMTRTAGVDMANYIYAFEYDYELIPDIGFQAIINFFNLLGLPFLGMMLAIGAVNYFAVLRLARHYGVSIGLLVILWFLHTVVVRDFAQLRSSLAISIAIFGITSTSKKSKLGFYVVCVSVHMSAAVFVLAYEACKMVSTIRSVRCQWILISLVSAIVASIGLMLPQLGFIDQRIELYLNFNKEGYGDEVSSFGSLVLHVLIVLLSIVFYRVWCGDQRLRVLFYMELLGIVSFIVLSGYAIFAFRLSNLIFSLYPVLLLSIVKGIGLKRNRYAGLMSIMLLWFFSLVLILRPGSLEILDRILL